MSIKSTDIPIISIFASYLGDLEQMYKVLGKMPHTEKIVLRAEVTNYGEDMCAAVAVPTTIVSNWITEEIIRVKQAMRDIGVAFPGE